MTDNQKEDIATVEGDRCHRCGSTDLWTRPDGTKLCGPCVIGAGGRKQGMKNSRHGGANSFALRRGGGS
jgi:hypothetical protein